MLISLFLPDAGMMTMKSECCTCGYTWVTGQDGGHQCAQHMLKRPDGFRYMVNYSSGQSRSTSIHFDEEPVSDMQILNQLCSLQAETSRLKSKLYGLAKYITDEVDKL